MNKSLPVEEALPVGQPVSIPKRWPTPRTRVSLVAKGEKALPQGPADSDRVELKTGLKAEHPPAAELPGVCATICRPPSSICTDLLAVPKHI